MEKILYEQGRELVEEFREVKALFQKAHELDGKGSRQVEEDCSDFLYFAIESRLKDHVFSGSVFSFLADIALTRGPYKAANPVQMDYWEARFDQSHIDYRRDSYGDPANPFQRQQKQGERRL